MPNPFCILPQHADAFLDKVKSGELAPDKLAKMTSEERRAAFAGIMGDAAAEKVNASFESRLLLKSQQKAITEWISKAGKLAPDVKRDLLSRVGRMENVLDPKTSTGFLADLAKQRLGFGVTSEEAANIVKLAKDASDAKAAIATGGDRMDYGRAKVAFGNYTSELRAGSKEPLTVGTALTKTAGFIKSVKIIGDLSALLKQGWKTLFSHPEIWGKNALGAFVDMAKEFGGKEMLDEVRADVASRPNALNGRYQKAHLDVGTTEEAIPSSLPEKIPFVRRFFKATEAGYTGFQYRTRADVFDKYIEIAKESGVDVDDRQQLQSIGKMVNSLTGRGDLGALEPSANALNVLFFSPRQLKSNIDFLTAHQFQKDVTPFVRKQAAVNTVKAIAGTAAVLGIAHTIAPGSVEWDPRSSNFGKIKIGNTRFDVSGGMSSILTLGARLATFSSKSTTTGKINKINSGKFGSQTGLDLVNNFLENKLSPAADIVKDLLTQKEFGGEPISVKGEATNLAPFPVSNPIEMAKDPSASPAFILLGTLADALGLSQSTIVPKHGKKK